MYSNALFWNAGVPLPLDSVSYPTKTEPLTSCCPKICCELQWVCRYECTEEEYGEQFCSDDESHSSDSPEYIKWKIIWKLIGASEEEYSAARRVSGDTVPLDRMRAKRYSRTGPTESVTTPVVMKPVSEDYWPNYLFRCSKDQLTHGIKSGVWSLILCQFLIAQYHRPYDRF
jgi:hypothetical protein